MDWIDHFYVQLAALATVLVAFGIVFRKGIVPLWRGLVALVHAVETLDAIAGYTAALPDALPVLMDIAEEFKPNGGSSLVDRIDRLETGQDNLCSQLETLLIRDPTARTRTTD